MEEILNPEFYYIDAFMEEDTFRTKYVTIDYWLLIISSTLSLQKTTSEMLPTVEVQEY